VLLNQAFHPDVVATAQMGKDLADALVRRGFRVSAIASRSIYGSSGAVLPKREAIAVVGGGSDTEKIQVSRVGFSLFGKASIAARIADFGVFYLLAAWRILTMPRADVVITYTTPPFVALLGLVHRALRGGKAVYWVMDLYPDLPVACGMMKGGAFSTKIFEKLNRMLLARSDVTVVLGRCMRERVLAKGVPPERVVMIPVWAETGTIIPIAHADNPLRGRWAKDPRDFVVMYSGNLGLGHDAKTMIEAMTLLKDEAHIKFVFVGGGKRRREVEDAAKQRGLTNVTFEPYQPRELVAQSLSAGDVHLISLKEGVEGIMVPSKLLGIMAVARPAIFVGHPSSEIARVISESGCGVCVREGEARALADAILALRDDPARTKQMGERGRQELVGKYDAASACAHWVTLLERLTSTPPPTP
jgi:colanic acid biosynthesis glycosyl transferase WcaI